LHLLIDFPFSFSCRFTLLTPNIRRKLYTRLSSIAAKYVEITGNITVEELDFPRVKAIGEDPTVEKMELKDFWSIRVHHKKK
jgi:hypothetical protein